ncbi:MAG: redoxin domain-containing protein [Phycisphaerales bacterium]|nr:redoxin domain-containing protein [Phycisphaerales bacterium]
MTESTRAPALDSPLGWLNTDRPLRLDGELRGQIVLLDFWTYCCINCIHILPDLKYLERKYADQPLVVIGVHSAKFTNESSRRTIRSAIHRYEMEHPVVVDDTMKIWRAYGVRSWPTFVLIDPEGFIALQVAGEGNRDTLDNAIDQLLKQHRSRGALAAGPLTLKRDGVVQPASGLAFPGKVLADSDRRQVFIADSNHHRIVICEWPDELGRCRRIRIVGCGVAGADDGPADAATFFNPQGMAIQGDILYVADTDNHLIRAVDLNTGQVTTAVGTGEMGYDRAGGGMGTRQVICTPWDLCTEGGTLYVAMAGTHQIWRIEMPVGFARALAGTGRENIADGPVETAALSQPSGICLHRGILYFADSEVSAIRGIDLAAERVFTIIGSGLFVFGDVDGTHPRARLQHPLGVTSWRDKLLIADTYNHKIKIVDPADRSATTLFGHGNPATNGPDGSLGLFEPGGLNAAGDTLFIADTNNHRVVMVELGSRHWHELTIHGLTAPDRSDRSNGHAIQSDAVTVAADAEITLKLTPTLPDGAHLNSDAPWTVRVVSDHAGLAQVTGHATHPAALPITIRFAVGRDDVTWMVNLTCVYCTDTDGGLCIPAEFNWRVPVRIRPGGLTTVSLQGQAAATPAPAC